MVTPSGGAVSSTVLPYGTHHPRIHSSVYLADGVVVSGDVEVGKDSSIWFNSVLRGDVHRIRIGECTNIQDLSMLHVTGGRTPLQVGSFVTVGHRAILHGCTVEDECLVGMGAIVLDDAVVGRGSLVAAGSVVTEGTCVPAGMLVAGIPAKVKRALTPEEVAGIRRSAEHYHELATTYLQLNREG